MRRFLFRLPAQAFLACGLLFALGAQALADTPVHAELQARLQGNAPLQAGGVSLDNRAAIKRFYADRAYAPAWNGKQLAQAQALLAQVAAARDEGLHPADYHHAALKAAVESVQKAPTPQAQVQLELIATDAFLAFGHDLLSGRLDPREIDTTWTLKPRSRDMVKVLQQALQQQDVAAALLALDPPYPGFVRLREALGTLRQQVAAGGWAPVSAIAKGEKLEVGAQDPRIVEIRNRLLVSGDLDATHNDGGELYDEALAEAVRRFQARHGLTEDAVIGPATVWAMNITARERLAQIETNLERWRWLPEDLGYRHILINIPGFELTVEEGGKAVLQAKVVVGTQVKPTPVFTGQMKYLVFSPYWNVPHSIASQELLPQMQRNPERLSRQKMQVITSGGQVLDPNSVNWGAYSQGDFPFRMRQMPGTANPLGRVKFMFPNKYDVYLHDTSNPGLFERSQRTFSHGCIRISKPKELAEYLLGHDPKWTEASIDAAMNSGRERSVPLPEPVPVHMLYWTAWVDEQGVLQFRNDIYQRDRAVVRALRAL